MYKFHFIQDRGARPEMQDAYVIPNDDFQIYAVFDGHGGSQCSQWCADNVKPMYITLLEKCANDHVSALMELFACMNRQLVDVAQRSGTTATVILFVEDKVHVANVGDSAAVLYRKGHEPAMLTVDHRVSDAPPEELAKVTECGGKIVGKRIMAALALTRSLGDYSFYPAVSARPRIRTFETQPGDYIILASDGLWDAIDMIDVREKVEWVRDDPVHMTEILAESALRSRDNYTIGAIILEEEESSGSYTFAKEFRKHVNKGLGGASTTQLSSMLDL